MGQAWSSSDACKVASTMALELACLGEGACVVELRRRALDSYDLAFDVQGSGGERKEVIVTNAALLRRIASLQTHG